MMVTEEIDALRSIGIAPQELLVLPKMIALTIALPLLTVYADVMGLIGGIVMSHSLLGLSAYNFVDRLADAVSVKSFLSGIGKAPVFAVLIALVGCFQGFQVTGSAEACRPAYDDQRRAVDFSRDRHRRRIFDRVQSSWNLTLITGRPTGSSHRGTRRRDALRRQTRAGRRRSRHRARPDPGDRRRQRQRQVDAAAADVDAGAADRGFDPRVRHRGGADRRRTCAAAAQTHRRDVSGRRAVWRHERAGECLRAVAGVHTVERDDDRTDGGDPHRNGGPRTRRCD